MVVQVRWSCSIANVREGEYILSPASVDHSVRLAFTVSQVNGLFPLVTLRQTFAAVPCFPTVREGGWWIKVVGAMQPISPLRCTRE